MLEATARKPGNVHPGASFSDLTCEHFLRAAEAMPRLAEHRGGVGRGVLDAVRATRGPTGGNANLGIILLLAPMAAVPAGLPLAAGIQRVLSRLTIQDAESVYEAIRLANPGGLGTAPEQDVAQPPTVTLQAAMQLAVERDQIARQYACGFADVLEFGALRLARRPDFADRWEQAIIHLHLEFMARQPDSLIARKCGPQIAAESAQRAREVLQAGWPENTDAVELLAGLDDWLRADGNRRNPGATADLVAASLFAALRESLIAIPEWVERGGEKASPRGTETPTGSP